MGAATAEEQPAPEVTQAAPDACPGRRAIALAVTAALAGAAIRRSAAAARRWWTLLLWAAAGCLLFSCYLPLSRTQPTDSDGSAIALQAWAMLHGNLLLTGWRLSDVSFWTTELPEYMLVELARGLNPDVVHVAAAITFTLLVLLAGAVGRGRRQGRDGRTGLLLAAGITAAPQLGTGVYVLLLDPDHTGTVIPVLAAWLLLDRAPRRWWVPPCVGLILGWAMVADTMVAITGIAPLAVVAVARCYRQLQSGERLRRLWFELGLLAAAAGAAAAAKGTLILVATSGGFRVWPVGSGLASFAMLPGHLLLAAHGLIVLFGGDFFSHRLGLVSGLAMLHWAGLGLAAWALCAAVRRLPGTGDLVSQLLAAGIIANLAAYTFGLRAVDLHSTREIAAVLPLAAALAGRLAGPRLAAAGMRPALLVVGTGYLLCLGREISAPPQPGTGQELATWLEAHQLTSGLAPYWQAESAMLASGGRLQLAPMAAVPSGVVRGGWESDAAWFDARRHTATFTVLPPGRSGVTYPWTYDVRAAFGQPARIYYAGGYTVLVWDRNLLGELGASG